MLRMLLFGFLAFVVYIIFKLIRGAQKFSQRHNDFARPNKQTKKTNNYDIKKEDIVDADFEEIKNDN